jgi:hypothetical protein
MNYVNAKEVKSNINAFDITSTDPYPIGTESYKIMDVPGNADIIKKTIKDFPKKSFWMTIQMFGSPEEGWSRCPNNAEIRCLAFLALNHGAKGLSFYNYYPEARRKIYSGRGISNELWDYMKELNHQIKTMSLPYLLGKDIENISSNSKELDIKAKSYNGKIYIIAVNHQDKKIVADISLPEIKTSHFNVKFEQRKTTAKDSKIIDNFAPFQTHIYEAEDLMKNKN